MFHRHHQFSLSRKHGRRWCLLLYKLSGTQLSHLSIKRLPSGMTTSSQTSVSTREPMMRQARLPSMPRKKGPTRREPPFTTALKLWIGVNFRRLQDLSWKIKMLTTLTLVRLRRIVQQMVLWSENVPRLIIRTARTHLASALKRKEQLLNAVSMMPKTANERSASKCICDFLNSFLVLVQLRCKCSPLSL